jgi:hypothetical protein
MLFTKRTTEATKTKIMFHPIRRPNMDSPRDSVTQSIGGHQTTPFSLFPFPPGLQSSNLGAEVRGKL